MAYNPSQNIPLSKPMGAGAFPLDGKFMFYTNGAGGIYKYRPFQNVAEVLAYFTATFRVGNFEILVNEGGTLSSDGGSITGGENKIYWFANGVTDSDLVLKISGSITKQSETIIADENGEATLTDPPAFPIFTVYNVAGYTISAQYDNASKVLSGLNPNEEHTIYMI